MFAYMFFNTFLSYYRFPWNVFCINKMCHCWTRQDMGIGSILWSFYMCCIRRYSTKVRLIKWIIKNTLINLFITFFCRLLELVEDCGPLPLANDKCKLDTDATNKTAPFPSCCPIFKCEAGAKLEYPEIKEEKKN